MSSELMVLEVPKKRKNIQGIILTIVIFVLSITSGYFYYEYSKLYKNGLVSKVQAEEEQGRLIKAVAKLILLPKDEIPTVATVTDIEKLRDQPFFKDAKNGNKVLIFPYLKQVIIYDPAANILVNVGTLGVSEEQVSQEEQVKAE